MAQAKREIDRRSENRCVFVGDLPGRMVHQSHELRFLALDISRKGLGILLGPCPAEGEEVQVEFEKQGRSPLRFTVKHIYGDGGDGEKNELMQRCGIELTPGQASDIDLIEIFTRYDTVNF